ncbi:hypothetical protein Bphy_6074 (plasmid) [Paraburkholderia phymatum STM815]|uniref:Uncharacterized protein n=1 Tax=Paraburkholderia phymatum (strain DSM 17167 / CIP 108236 / LMG 21445 / STM815) TaxID=391038 RepID=B2JW06_PARP8|nr:hypothetical protein Bphy_6074 [Paraburkholderia phymatum STM815]
MTRVVATRSTLASLDHITVVQIGALVWKTIQRFPWRRNPAAMLAALALAGTRRWRDIGAEKRARKAGYRWRIAQAHKQQNAYDV